MYENLTRRICRVQSHLTTFYDIIRSFFFQVNIFAMFAMPLNFSSRFGFNVTLQIVMIIKKVTILKLLI